MSLVRLLGAVDGIISIKTHLKGAFGFSGILNLAFLFIDVPADLPNGVCLTLAAPEHQEMNGQVEVTWRTLRTVTHSLMVHARIPEVYVHFALMYMTDHIFPVLPIKDLIN